MEFKRPTFRIQYCPFPVAPLAVYTQNIIYTVCIYVVTVLLEPKKWIIFDSSDHKTMPEDVCNHRQRGTETERHKWRKAIQPRLAFNRLENVKTANS